MNMKQWVADQIAAEKKQALPVLTFPAAEKLGITAKELIFSADLQAQAMQYIHDNTDMSAVLAFMDLSVEAEAFGSDIRYSDDEVPTVVGSIVDEDSDPDELEVPDCREGRTGVCIEAIRKVAANINDKPVIAGNIGPFSLAGRLMDVNEVMFLCYDEPDLVHAVLDKVTGFLIDYTKELRAAGADGVMMAEPLAGLLSPELTEEFSNPYVKRIVDECQNDEFAIFVHNCGGSVEYTIDSIVEIGAMGYHLGNAVDMEKIMPHIPEGVMAMGNIDPAGLFRHGTPERIYEETTALMERCTKYPNFIISSGCDIPQLSPWENIDAFFKAVSDFYSHSSVEIETAEAPVEMTSMERFYAALDHKPVDRVPVFPFIAGTNRVLVGADHKTWAFDADVCANGYIEMTKMFPEQDFVLAAIDFTVECSAWGQKVIYTGNNPGKPDYANMLVKAPEDYANIKAVAADSSARMMMLVDVCERLVKEFKGEKPVIAYVMGPLSTLSMMRGQKYLSRDLADCPELVKAAADQIAQTLVEFEKELLATGIDGILWDTYYASSAACDKDVWVATEGNTLAQMAELVRESNGVNMVHCCQRGVFFDALLDTVKPDVVSFFRNADDCADMAETKAKYGDKTTLMGCVTPWNSVFGTDLAWDEECVKVVDTLCPGSGFILAPGCFYPANASFGRAKRMIDLAVKHGPVK